MGRLLVTSVTGGVAFGLYGSIGYLAARYPNLRSATYAGPPHRLDRCNRRAEPVVEFGRTPRPESRPLAEFPRDPTNAECPTQYLCRNR